MSDATPGVVVLISGRGSNMLAIAQAGREGRIPARVVGVISDRADAAGLARARELGIPATVVPVVSGDRAAHGRALAAAIEAQPASLVALRYEGRLLNVHPSLLPAYPGLHTHRRALAAGERLHGCTVHFVTEELDAGPAVIQARVPVLPGDDVASLSARVQRWEHTIYPEAIGWFAAGRLAWRDGGPWLDGRRLTAPVQRGEA